MDHNLFGKPTHLLQRPLKPTGIGTIDVQQDARIDQDLRDSVITPEFAYNLVGGFSLGTAADEDLS